MPELIYITHGNLLHLTYVAALPSFLILVGAAYGCIRLVLDVLKLVGSRK